jgi:hypothetical protein
MRYFHFQFTLIFEDVNIDYSEACNELCIIHLYSFLITVLLRTICVTLKSRSASYSHYVLLSCY